MAFSRWQLGWARTWSYRLFKAHHTELNELYWAHSAALRNAYASTRTYKKSDPANGLFSLPAEDITRININLGEWAKRYNEFDNWVRLNALVSISGYLEVYLQKVVRLALESDPACVLGQSRAVDGVKILKSSRHQNYSEQVISCVKGTWPKRLANYRRLFGEVPKFLDDSVGELEKIRVTRNGVTHAFGRAPNDYTGRLEVSPKPFQQVTLKRLKKTLALVDKVAISVDEHLGKKHIGDYEAIVFYHNWKANYVGNPGELPMALRSETYKLHGRNLPSPYYQRLIQYYDSL